MARRKNDRPTSIYWLLDVRPETLTTRPNGLPFYCGKTVLPLHQRLAQHKYEAANGERAVHHKVRECGDHLSIFSMEVVLIDADWSAREKHWIEILRFSFPGACNTANGGAGAPGWIPTAETRAKIVVANIGRTQSAETRAKISKFMMGRVQPPESLARMRAKLKGRIRSPEHCAKISASKKGKPGTPHTPERRAKISAGNKGKKRTFETLLRMSEGAQRAHLERVKARGVCPSILLSLPC